VSGRSFSLLSLGGLSRMWSMKMLSVMLLLVAGGTAEHVESGMHVEEGSGSSESSGFIFGDFSGQFSGDFSGTFSGDFSGVLYNDFADEGSAASGTESGTHPQIDLIGLEDIVDTEEGIIFNMPEPSSHRHFSAMHRAADIDDASGSGSGEEFEGSGSGEESNGTMTGDSKNTTTKVCKRQEICFSDSECGNKGRCVGAFVGKCNCLACRNGLSCLDDTYCGGLSGACDVDGRQRCNCLKGFQANGFATRLAATQNLCNKKSCDRSQDTCFGLPCRFGRCIC